MGLSEIIKVFINPPGVATRGFKVIKALFMATDQKYCNCVIGEDFDWDPIRDLRNQMSMLDGKYSLETSWNDNRIINLQDDFKEYKELLTRAIRVESHLFALAEKVTLLEESIKLLSSQLENYEKDLQLSQ